MRKDVEVDHVVPCGSIKGYEDIGPWIERQTVEDINGFQVLCKAKCHLKKTNKEKEGRKKQ